MRQDYLFSRGLRDNKVTQNGPVDCHILPNASILGPHCGVPGVLIDSGDIPGGQEQSEEKKIAFHAVELSRVVWVISC